jgi:hypothetical protein
MVEVLISAKSTINSISTVLLWFALELWVTMIIILEVKMSNFIFVDVEADGSSPVNGTMTEFGAVHEKSLQTFHGVLFEATPDPESPAKPIVGARVDTDANVASRFTTWLKEVGGNERPVFVSDNVAYDWMWIAGMYDKAGFVNPFGWSGRRLSDFWAGLQHDFGNTQSWKSFRKTPHDHNPVNDAMGNVEAFQEIKRIAKELRK